ncbi:hypothetical protein TNCT_167051 [Trichonephila clavata]|uniref:Uncharacterized protein n=1 Tax=Trichonephila clavata TaxID=2740835 RepID=A0A8X6J6J3_TRICU|nr:hypothetical protein TNCT_167051 [Trichonephila clavata]
MKMRFREGLCMALAFSRWASRPAYKRRKAKLAPATRSTAWEDSYANRYTTDAVEETERRSDSNKMQGA